MYLEYEELLRLNLLFFADMIAKEYDEPSLTELHTIIETFIRDIDKDLRHSKLNKADLLDIIKEQYEIESETPQYLDIN